MERWWEDKMDLKDYNKSTCKLPCYKHIDLGEVGMWKGSILVYSKSICSRSECRSTKEHAYAYAFDPLAS